MVSKLNADSSYGVPTVRASRQNDLPFVSGNCFRKSPGTPSLTIKPV